MWLIHIWSLIHIRDMTHSHHTKRRQKHEWVMSHVWMRHVTDINESPTHIDESFHTYEWVTFQHSPRNARCLDFQRLVRTSCDAIRTSDTHIVWRSTHIAMCVLNHKMCVNPISREYYAIPRKEYARHVTPYAHCNVRTASHDVRKSDLQRVLCGFQRAIRTWCDANESSRIYEWTNHVAHILCVHSTQYAHRSGYKRHDMWLSHEWTRHVA